MPLTPERMAELDQYYAGQQPDYLTQLTPDKPTGLSPQRIAELDAYYAQNQPKAPAQPQVGMGRTAFDQAMQGATFGFADEIQNGLGAFGAKVYSTAFDPELTNGKSIGDLYNEATAASKERLAAEMNQNPGTSIAANVAGGLLTSAAGATTAAGTAIGNGIRTGLLPQAAGGIGRAANLASKVAIGAGAGAASGGIYGAGTADEGNRIEGAKQGAILGGAFGAAIPAASATASALKTGAQDVVQGAIARSPEGLQKTAESMKSGAGDLYNKMRQIGAVLNPGATQGLITNIDTAVAKQKFIAALNPKTIAIIEDIKHAAKNGTLGLDDLDQYRRLLSRVGGSEDGVSAGAARKAIDDVVSNLTNQHLVNGGQDAIKLLQQGRAQYAKASKFEDITDILTKADGDPNRIKAGLTRFLNNSDNLKGFSSEEIAALKNAARSGIGEKLLKMGGKFGIDLGSSLTPGNTIGPIIGGAINPLAPVAGTAARQGQKYLARGKAEKLLQTIQNRPIPAGQNALPSTPMGNPFITQMASRPMGLVAAKQVRVRP